jgi:hypothetical protein
MTPADRLRALLDGADADIRITVREWRSRPGNAPVADLPRVGAPALGRAA